MSESGQVHAQHLAICGQVIKKKDAPCLGPKFKQAVANFLAAKVQISTSESGQMYLGICGQITKKCIFSRPT